MTLPSGSTRRDRRVSPRAPSTSTTTCGSARRPTPGTCSGSGPRTKCSRRPSSSSPTGSATPGTSPWAWARRACSFRTGRPRRRCSRSSRASARRSSSVSRRSTPPCWRSRRPRRASTCRPCGSACPRARPCPRRFTAAGRSASAWRSSMGSGPPKSCTSSCRIGRARPDRARRASGARLRGHHRRRRGPAGAGGEMGNLRVKGDSTMAYYWNKHDKTRDTLFGPWIQTGTSIRATRTATSGTPGAPTTCSRWVASGSRPSRSRQR